ncbi:MAG: hypothetical protein AB1411_02445 [Nitrospirota bacterium]
MHTQFAQFTTVKGLSDRIRLPRLGKIRLGIKVIGQNGEYPKDVPYFVVPPEVARIYGNEPTALDIMFPVNDRNLIFPQAFKYYGSSKGLKCIGNGEQALRVDPQTGGQKPCECPCSLLETKECQLRANLMVILPKVNMGGVYQIDSTSYHTVVDINSGIYYVENLVKRFAMVPLVLKRVPRETHPNGQKQIHYPLQVHLENADENFVLKLRSETEAIIQRTSTLVLPAPEDVNPELDEGATVVREEDLQAPTEENVIEGQASETVAPSQVTPAATASKMQAKNEGSADAASSSEAAPPPLPSGAPMNGGAPSRTETAPERTVLSVTLPVKGRSGKYGPYQLSVMEVGGSRIYRCWESSLPGMFHGQKAMELIGKRIILSAESRAGRRPGETEFWITRFKVDGPGQDPPVAAEGTGESWPKPESQPAQTVPPSSGSTPAQPLSSAPPMSNGPRMMSEAQKGKIHRLCQEKQIPEDRVQKTIQGMTLREASKLIDAMTAGDFSAFDLAEMETLGAGDEERY